VSRGTYYQCILFVGAVQEAAAGLFSLQRARARLLAVAVLAVAVVAVAWWRCSVAFVVVAIATVASCSVASYSVASRSVGGCSVASCSGGSCNVARCRSPVSVPPATRRRPHKSRHKSQLAQSHVVVLGAIQTISTPQPPPSASLPLWPVDSPASSHQPIARTRSLVIVTYSRALPAAVATAAAAASARHPPALSLSSAAAAHPAWLAAGSARAHVQPSPALPQRLVRRRHKRRFLYTQRGGAVLRPNFRIEPVVFGSMCRNLRRSRMRSAEAQPQLARVGRNATNSRSRSRAIRPAARIARAYFRVCTWSLLC